MSAGNKLIQGSSTPIEIVNREPSHDHFVLKRNSRKPSGPDQTIIKPSLLWKSFCHDSDLSDYEDVNHFSGTSPEPSWNMLEERYKILKTQKVGATNDSSDSDEYFSCTPSEASWNTLEDKYLSDTNDPKYVSCNTLEASGKMQKKKKKPFRIQDNGSLTKRNDATSDSSDTSDYLKYTPYSSSESWRNTLEERYNTFTTQDDKPSTSRYNSTYDSDIDDRILICYGSSRPWWNMLERRFKHLKADLPRTWWITLEAKYKQVMARDGVTCNDKMCDEGA